MVKSIAIMVLLLGSLLACSSSSIQTLPADAQNARTQRVLYTLSTDKEYRILEQVVSINKRRGRLELGINWKKTRPITFSKSNQGTYIDFFNSVISSWDSYASRTIDANKNTFDLGDLPTHRGVISAVFFRRQAHGPSLPDNKPRLRLVYCKKGDFGCIHSQVHFYSKEQVVTLRNIIAEGF